jgi:hypothetical protein
MSKLQVENYHWDLKFCIWMIFQAKSTETKTDFNDKKLVFLWIFTSYLSK